VHPFHFGSSERRLFGVYHGAEQSRPRSRGVVICQPFGHEYIRAHRALRQMAAQLAAAGVHVLRFDYYGCGDSAGDGHEGSLTQWVTDVHTAIDELKDTADLSSVSLAGVRLGATLGALAAAARDDVDTLLLWDPVLKGGEYVRAQLDLQRRWLATRSWITAPPHGGDEREIIGFPLPEGLARELNDVDLAGVNAWPSRRTAILTSREIDARPLADRLRERSAPCAVEAIPSDCEWERAAAVHLVLLAPALVERACGVLTAEAA
jgi:pimeloyl-ACP methyl ester carboxylesterase